MAHISVESAMKLIRGGDDFHTEPVGQCPRCGAEAHAEWVDIGFGAYSQQAGPFHCFECGWTETGCPQDECVQERCISWEICRGVSIVKGN